MPAKTQWRNTARRCRKTVRRCLKGCDCDFIFTPLFAIFYSLIITVFAFGFFDSARFVRSCRFARFGFCLFGSQPSGAGRSIIFFLFKDLFLKQQINFFFDLIVSDKTFIMIFNNKERALNIIKANQ